MPTGRLIEALEGDDSSVTWSYSYGCSNIGNMLTRNASSAYLGIQYPGKRLSLRLGDLRE